MSEKEPRKVRRIRADRLGSLTLDDLVNDSKRWQESGDYGLNDPYFELTNPKTLDEFGELHLYDLVNISEYEEDNGIPRAHIDLSDLLVEYLTTNEDYMVLVALLQEVFDDIKSVADVFDQLADVESVIELFLPKLAYLLNYRYHYEVPDSVNRDIIRRLLWLYEQKATDQDVRDAADYGNNDKWVGSTLFMPDAEPDPRTAEIYYPVHDLFTHDVSAHSTTDRYPDSGRYRGGVIVIKVKRFTDKIREAVKRVLPAGLKCYYDFDGSFGGDATLGTVDFGANCEVYEDFLIDYQLAINDRETSQWFDGYRKDKHIFSGRQILFFDNVIDYLVGVSWFIPLPEDDPEGNVQHDPSTSTFPMPDPKIIHKGFATYSERGALSGKSTRVGSDKDTLRLEGDGNVMWLQTPLGTVVPTDRYYTVDSVEDLVVDFNVHDSRYHQMYVDTDRFAMNGYWVSPDSLEGTDWVEGEDRTVHRVREVDLGTVPSESGMVRRAYSNHFYREDRTEPIVLRWDRLRRFDFDGIQSYALPEEIPIDHFMGLDLGFLDPDVRSDVFDGTWEHGNVFDGREKGVVDIEVLLIREPFLRVELVLDREETGSNVYDGEDTYYGDVRSGLPYFYTDPFEFGGIRDVEVVVDSEPNPSPTTELSGEDMPLGEVRSGVNSDLTNPVEVSVDMPEDPSPDVSG